MRRVIDVTDLTVWHGNLSGIQRVVYEMTIRYVGRPDVEFCYYVEQDQRFYRISDIYALLHPAGVAIEGSNDSQSKLRAQVIHRTKRGLRALTPPIITRLSRAGSARLQKVIGRRDNGRRVEHVFRQGDTSFLFQPEDILIVYGAHWDKPHYTKVVSDLKETIGIRLVHNINDFIPVYDRAHTAEVEHERFPRYMQAICELSDAILFISEETGRDYERFLVDYNITNRAKTGVMILGEDINQKQAERPKNIVDEPFILNVGTIEVRKNPVLLYQVYRLAEERGVDLPHLYLVGRMGWLTGDIYYQMTHDSRVSDKIHIRHDIDDRGLSWMYDHCEFFVFPSYYEGWGLPVAEAAHHHKVSVASRSSSIPEVLGEYAEYFSPYSADECLNAIVTMMDKAHRTRCEKKLRDRAPHTWDDTYIDAEKIIDKVN